jgi:hypothetical protein
MLSAPSHMYQHRNQTIKNFGYDDETDVDYGFNGLGYRSRHEFDDIANAIVVLGGSVAFGLGLDIDDTFAEIVANKTGIPVYNFAWGCYAHTNTEQIELLETILDTAMPRSVIFQLNNLNRKRVGATVEFNNTQETIEKEYNDFYQRAMPIFQRVDHDIIHWDNEEHKVDLPQCLIYNKYHVDCSLQHNPETFGKVTHKLIANKILQKINDQRL